MRGSRLLLSWGANFFSGEHTFWGTCLTSSRNECISKARDHGKHELANLLESELGGRRCEIVLLTSRPELNGKKCVVDEYLPDSNQYKVTLETKSKEPFFNGFLAFALAELASKTASRSRSLQLA